MYTTDASPTPSVSHSLEQPVEPTVSAPAGYSSIWKIWLPVAAVFVLLDVTFNLYFWRIPKLTKANADYGYQFVVDALPVWQPGIPGSTRVVAFGSSIALSFDPRQVQSLLDAAGPRATFDVHRLLLPGIHPSDYLMYFDQREMKRTPDAVVILVNLVDFLYPNTESDLNPTLRFIQSPWRLLAERHQYMSITSELDAVLSGVSRLYRYRRLIRSSLQDHVRAALRWLRSRSPTLPYGIDADGYTRQRFAVPLPERGPAMFKYFIDPEWIRQRGRVTLELSVGGKVLRTQVESTPGWKLAVVEIDSMGPGLLEVRVDSVWTERAANAAGEPRLRGVLLAEAFGPSAAAEEPLRYQLWTAGEIDEFLRMGGKAGDDFAGAWRATLDGHTRFGQRFRVYRDAKLALTAQPFQPTGEYEAVGKLVDLFRDRGAEVLVINSPESPWILGEYRDTAYYRGYLEFLRGLDAKSTHVHFYDWSDTLPAEDFNDWHHPSYIGSIKLGGRYAEAVRQVLPASDGERRH